MAARRAYLDHNASAPLLEEARAAMLDALSVAANPSSVHSEGRAARRMLEEARASVAALVNGKPQHVVFTSGATEAAATLLSPHWTMGRAPLAFSRVYVSAADHPCVLKGGRFSPEAVVEIRVAPNGLVDLDDLKARLDAHDTSAGLALVAIHAVNNETGVIQPVEEIGRIAHASGAVVVLDAVQAAGRIPVDISKGYADYLILSSHKIGGPKGVGAIVSAADLMMPVPLIVGGGQEKGHRAGTENLAAIVGFGAAARCALAGLDRIENVATMRDRIEELVVAHVPDAVFFGRAAERVANTSFFSIPGMKAETVQIAFDLAGVALSSGSACSSGRVGPSHVLQAMGFGEDASALRVSIGPSTGEEEIGLFADALAGIARRRKGKAEAA
ncbi:nitrogenase cofactor synthesis protein nifS [Nitratireductor indicus C115]|uniref:Cysteine desulfurase n=1 Tax=Nitratireductor indicus C115 TaxID=1231190 RepID=K2N0V6_9HYPH|nr:cysteine desulfurase family protein [Nitratireductor indicus]EKF41098.1 nitrogenase cofactor synthesis protein nifS [Nitratireductor indicus C115]SFQ74370.1 cysteine desulfurase [Nitratireductor indicus]